mmetsp:Transcript_30763/g.65069  ORF Transcript_30763/g.65069 Transcript_30763/m.65069 type:complete len:305 (-) Transcript_30763:317-1231(-)
MSNNHSALSREGMIEVGNDLDSNISFSRPRRAYDGCKTRTKPRSDGTDLHRSESNVIPIVTRRKGIRRCLHPNLVVLPFIFNHLYSILLSIRRHICFCGNITRDRNFLPIHHQLIASPKRIPQVIHIQKGIPIIQRGIRRSHPQSLARKRLHFGGFVRSHRGIPSISQQNGHQPRWNGSIHGIGTSRHQSADGFQHSLKVVLSAMTTNDQVERFVHVRAGPGEGVRRILRGIQRDAQISQFSLGSRPAALGVFQGGVRQHHAGLVADLQDHASPNGAHAVPRGTCSPPCRGRGAPPPPSHKTPR